MVCVSSQQGFEKRMREEHAIPIVFLCVLCGFARVLFGSGLSGLGFVENRPTIRKEKSSLNGNVNDFFAFMALFFRFLFLFHHAIDPLSGHGRAKAFIVGKACGTAKITG